MSTFRSCFLSEFSAATSIVFSVVTVVLSICAAPAWGQGIFLGQVSGSSLSSTTLSENMVLPTFGQDPYTVAVQIDNRLTTDASTVSAVPHPERMLTNQITGQDTSGPATTLLSTQPPAVANRPHYLPPIELEPGGVSADPGCVNPTEKPYPNYRHWRHDPARAYEWQMFPEGLLWPAYLAGVKESRFRGVWHKEDKLGWIWDITLGGRAGILRYGNRNAVLPTGIQLDIEGAAMTRLAMDIERDLEATDYRFGLPVTIGNERWQFKISYYHVSCHLGDEYMIRYWNEHKEKPRRINYYRDSIVLGLAFRPHRDMRLYGEFEYACYAGEMTGRVQLQFGAEYAPMYPANRWRGAPFLAVHGLLLEELDYGGSICVQVGWMWRGKRNQAFRIGFEYFQGADDQYEFFDDTNSKCGLGLWYDF